MREAPPQLARRTLGEQARLNVARAHPREEVTWAARVDFDDLILSWARRHDLTHVEAAQIIAGAVQTELRFALRVERHGDDQQAAGWE